MLVFWFVGVCCMLVALLAYGSWRVCENGGEVWSLFEDKSPVFKSTADTLISMFMTCFMGLLLCVGWFIVTPIGAIWLLGKVCHESKKHSALEADEDYFIPVKKQTARQTIVGDDNVQVGGNITVPKKRRSKKLPDNG